MKLKTKLIATISAFCLVCVMLVVGVWALKNTSFDIGGKINFTASGVKATVSTGELSNGTHKTSSDATSKLQGFSILVNDTQEQIDTKSAGWENLDLLFNEDGEDVKITFTIHNDNTDSDKYLSVAIGVTQGTRNNATVSISPTSAIIDPNDDQEFVVTFHIENTDKDASLDGFNLNVNLNHAKVVTLDANNEAEGVTYSLNSTNQEATVNYFEAEEIIIPALVSDGTKVYKVTSIEATDETMGYGASGNMTKLVLPETITYIQPCLQELSVEVWYVYAITPPSIDDLVLEVSKIYVPAESVDDYKENNDWYRFADKIYAIGTQV